MPARTHLAHDTGTDAVRGAPASPHPGVQADAPMQALFATDYEALGRTLTIRMPGAVEDAAALKPADGPADTGQ